MTADLLQQSLSGALTNYVLNFEGCSSSSKAMIDTVEQTAHQSQLDVSAIFSLRVSIQDSKAFSCFLLSVALVKQLSNSRAVKYV